jgi:arginine transport system substrate-binding protein
MTMMLLLTGCTKQNNQDTLVLATNANYPPYESVDQQGNHIGFDIDVAHALAKQLGKKLVIKDMTFDALILALKQGKCDLVMSGISITPSREKEMAMVPYQGEAATSLTLLFWEKATPGVKALSDLQSRTVAVQSGTYMENYLNKFKEVTPKALDSTVELIMDIKHGKSAAALVEPRIASEVMPKHVQLKRIDFALPEEDWVLGNGIGIKKGNTELINDIKNAIAALKSDGTLKGLEEKWFSKKVV